MNEKYFLVNGASVLLRDTVQILKNHEVEYLILGGWSPYLLNKGELGHPGTKDVDILLRSARSPGEIEVLIQAFIDNGFMQSAKHPFQLLKSINIGGHEFVFNVDLLHPTCFGEEGEMFVDHLVFPIHESESMMMQYCGATIKVPNSDIFFDECTYDYEGILKDHNGHEFEINFKLLSSAGLIISKLESIYLKKRQRDAYDIYLALVQSSDYYSIVSNVKSIIEKHPAVMETIEKLVEDSSLKMIVKNIHFWANQLGHCIPEENIIETFKKFVNEVSSDTHL